MPSSVYPYSYFSLSDLTVQEGQEAQVTVSRVGDSSTDVLINLSITSGTAKSGSDYTDFTGNISILKGETSVILPIKTLTDTLYEGNEFFTVVGNTLSGPTSVVNAWITNKGKVTILDNNAASPTVGLTLSASAYAAPTLTPAILPTYVAGNQAMDKYYYYVERYPLTLKANFIADYIAGKATNEAIWGQNHWLNYGKSVDGRVLEVTTGAEDTKDYGAYVENYGTTLLDIYRKDPRAALNGGTMSMFAWGKEHYNNWGKAEGREIDGGVDWGAIVRNKLDLFNKWQDAKRANPTLSAFAYGYQNQSSITQDLTVKIGSDTPDKLTGSIVYGLNASDVIVGTSANDILVGGFGDDLIVGVNGGTDTVFGGPGSDIFLLNEGTTLNIRDFRKGADLIQLGDSLNPSGITKTWSGEDNITSFYNGSSLLAQVFGKTPTDFTYADSSNGVTKVFI